MEEPQDSYKLIENRDAMDLVPTWGFEMWWFFALGAAICAGALIVLYFCKRGTKGNSASHKDRAYREALEELLGLSSGDPKETAIRVSLIIRSYLAKHLEEPALYETHEEFVSRHDALAKLPESTKLETRGFFSQLAELKYGPTGDVCMVSDTLKRDAVELLERIHKS